jgi:pSer/pThr/pTyr-binding forkhead associated (FHA) protein
MLIGRHSEADLRLPLPDVSRHHCRFMFADGAWQVVDLDSLNGVIVNGQRVKRATLQHRDSVVIGSFRFEVELSSNANSSPQTPAVPAEADDVIRRIAGSLLPAAADANAAYRKAS